MKRFIQHEGVAAALRLDSLDIDAILSPVQIVPAAPQLLGTPAFFSLRYALEGAERPEFILNQAPYRRASILLANCEFGAGSARPEAARCLDAFGIRVLIAPSFGHHFFTACVQQGLLLIVLPGPVVDRLMATVDEIAGEAPLLIDLPSQAIFSPLHAPIRFHFAPELKARLLAGENDAPPLNK